MLPEPTISDFLETARKGVVVEDRVADLNRGSDYESLAGPNAILWSRQTQRDTDLFKAVRYNDAEGDDLTKLIERRYAIPRIKETRGAGTASLSRASSAGGAGTVWAGTRIRLGGPTQDPRFYRVTQDTPVTATALGATVPIEAVAPGLGSKASGATALTQVVDALWDASWAVIDLQCADGTALESAPTYRARARTLRLNARPGFEQAIIDACATAGAGNVALFRGDYAGPNADYGLNYAYVGDLGYSATPQLVRACTLALRSVRIAGDNLQVLPLVRTNLAISVDIYLRASPSLMPIARLEPLHRKAILQYFTDQGQFTYTVSGIESAIARTGDETQDIVLASPTADATILVNGAFPQQLSRYFVSDSNITIRYLAPE